MVQYKPMERIAGCAGFQWDDGNSAKISERHGVSPAECEQAFFNSPLIVADDNKHSANEARFYALGQSDSGRLLFVAFTVREKLIRVISARDMSRRERKIYLSS
ncbi:MAG: BrnT family toxin [Candidatus Binatus sp.]|uniref:BrnT family toxin n=1 Tax=Candidatus Binatus sp. TaxID=2811406 RepID=UPI00272378C3|nr:BrnT family toxin [Candidatus Binatus sp.]MDO8433393.1 BrnT family toxin [Candidatus Binatus sp.]